MGFFGFIYNMIDVTCMLCIIGYIFLEAGVIAPRKTKQKENGWGINDVFKAANEVKKMIDGNSNQQNNNKQE